MIAVLLSGLLAAAPQASSYRVAGTVVNAVTSQPVTAARVTLAPIEHRDQRLAYVTGADGRFVFAGLPAGKYELSGQGRGLLPASYDQHASLTSSVAAGPGQETDALVLRLEPPGSISGKVVDDIGEPVEHATVELLRSRVVTGHRRLTHYDFGQTDDRGEYRFSSVPAGTYYLAASGYPWYTKLNGTLGDAPPAAITHTGYGIRYHPNVSDPAAAEPLLLKAGQEATADFALNPVPAASVHVHFENGQGFAKRMTLTAAGLAGNQVSVRQGKESEDFYNFWGIPPGHYVLKSLVLEGGRTLFAKNEIDVAAADMDVRVTLLEAPSLTGTLVLDGGGSLPPGLGVLLYDDEAGRTMASPVGADGKFAFPAAPPQRCQVSLTRADDIYLKSWSAEGARRDGELLDIAEGATVRLKLLAAKGAGSIHGTVEHAGHPFAGGLVVLAPAAGSNGPDVSRAFQSDSDGSYYFRGVPPGDYALFAVPNGAEFEYANPAAVRPHVGSAEKIRVAPGGTYTKRLELAPAAKN